VQTEIQRLIKYDPNLRYKRDPKQGRVTIDWDPKYKLSWWPSGLEFKYQHSVENGRKIIRALYTEYNQVSKLGVKTEAPDTFALPTLTGSCMFYIIILCNLKLIFYVFCSFGYLPRQFVQLCTKHATAREEHVI
jgi:hypothetical protein